MKPKTKKLKKTYNNLFLLMYLTCPLFDMFDMACMFFVSLLLDHKEELRDVIKLIRVLYHEEVV